MRRRLCGERDAAEELRGHLPQRGRAQRPGVGRHPLDPAQPEGPGVREDLKPLVPVLLLAWALPARAAPSVEELVGRAHQQRLAEDEQWIRLGHWRRTLLGGWESEADGPDFFLAA